METLNGNISTGGQNPPATVGCSCGAHSRKKRRLRLPLLGFGLTLVIGVWIFREPLRRAIFARAALANDAPTAEVIDEMIGEAADPQAAILAAWNTGKIVQRQVAILTASHIEVRDHLLSAQLHEIILAAALDPDMDVREMALNTLDYRHDPALPALAAAQLRDLDPQARLLGLKHLKQVPAEVGVPLVLPLLDDTDPQIVAFALKQLENWSGERFGVRLGDAVPIEDEKTGLTVFHDESYSKTRAGAERAKAWWTKRERDFAPGGLKIPTGTLAAAKRIQADDFMLRDLEGNRVRLADFRGKVVLINFWTTWCTACVSEIPELIALQKHHNGHLAILGVSLDFVPDEDARDPLPSGEVIRRKVVRTVKARGINYPILLDEHNEVGGRFNGGELPTTVIVDADGNVRRRFIGTRNLAVFEAMIAEASQPARQSSDTEAEVAK